MKLIKVEGIRVIENSGNGDFSLLLSLFAYLLSATFVFKVYSRLTHSKPRTIHVCV